MFEPVRGGTRGGQAEFKWTDVSADKDRENYLGHSINAPTGRWQKNKDVHWYSRDIQDDAAQRAEEIRKVKEAEAEALSAALGFAPKAGVIAAVVASPTDPTKLATTSAKELDQTKEEKRRRKAERKEAKRERKEKRLLERSRNDDNPRDDYRRRSNRSSSPRRLDSGRRDSSPPRSGRYRSRSPAPERHPSRPSRDVDHRDHYQPSSPRDQESRSHRHR
ncbi:hypothetical protein HGRIS_003652 [Hohenbuehelia grisea]|uniref:Multiple myeloma tumor-associated protein 2-like N-terminal domain-containing protein n=1 Tax=Hohenbuehelia grisea TaxID=104357 RepID=A0ABR3JH10_9AGAR